MQNEARNRAKSPTYDVKHDTEHDKRDKNAFDVEFPLVNEFPVNWCILFSAFKRLLPKSYSKKRIDDSAEHYNRVQNPCFREQNLLKFFLLIAHFATWLESFSK